MIYILQRVEDHGGAEIVRLHCNFIPLKRYAEFHPHQSDYEWWTITKYAIPLPAWGRSIVTSGELIWSENGDLAPAI